MVLNNSCECIHTLRKDAYGLVHARLCKGAAASLLWKLLRTYLESCAKHRAGCRVPPALLPAQPLPTPSVARRCSLKKSIQIHAISWRGRPCGVAQASSDHPRWCRPHPVCLWVALALGRAEVTRHRNAISPFSRELNSVQRPMAVCLNIWCQISRCCLRAD